MAYTLVFATTILLSFVAISVSQIQEPSQYAATAIPNNPSRARQELGYNKYDRSEVQNSDKTILYGNNWEQYDAPSKPQNQDPYYGNANGFQQPYRYYRSILVY